MLRIDEFKTEISAGGGVARTNLFMVELPPASAIRNAQSNLGTRAIN